MVDRVRCANDLNLFESLLKEKEVQKTNNWILRESKKVR